MTHAPIEIAPSILAANFARLGEEIRMVQQAGAEVIHVDVMDGHFVPNISIGIPVVESLRKATHLPLDVHLMIEQPEEYIEEFVRAGASRVLIHEESTVHLDRALAMIREHGAEAGAAINPATPVMMLSEVLDKLDTVLVMSVNPGFGGQKFLRGALEKMPASGSRWMEASIWKTSPSLPRLAQIRLLRGLQFFTQAIRLEPRASCVSLPAKR
jgi:ribulose-phosphate 3-epimerase